MPKIPGIPGDYDIHYGSTGAGPQSVNFNPDNNRNGLWIEGGLGETSGVFMNDNTMAVWSPSDRPGGLLEIFDEDDFDPPPAAQPVPMLRLVGTDTTLPDNTLALKQGQTVLFVFVNGAPSGPAASLQQVKLGPPNSGGAPGFRMLRVEMP